LILSELLEVTRSGRISIPVVPIVLLSPKFLGLIFLSFQVWWSSGFRASTTAISVLFSLSVTAEAAPVRLAVGVVEEGWFLWEKAWVGEFLRAVRRASFAFLFEKNPPGCGLSLELRLFWRLSSSLIILLFFWLTVRTVLWVEKASSSSLTAGKGWFL